MSTDINKIPIIVIDGKEVELPMLVTATVADHKQLQQLAARIPDATEIEYLAILLYWASGGQITEEMYLSQPMTFTRTVKAILSPFLENLQP